jgi:hypothetical protein
MQRGSYLVDMHAVPEIVRAVSQVSETTFVHCNHIRESLGELFRPGTPEERQTFQGILHPESKRHYLFSAVNKTPVETLELMCSYAEIPPEESTSLIEKLQATVKEHLDILERDTDQSMPPWMVEAETNSDVCIESCIPVPTISQW